MVFFSNNIREGGVIFPKSLCRCGLEKIRWWKIHMPPKKSSIGGNVLFFPLLSSGLVELTSVSSFIHTEAPCAQVYEILDQTEGCWFIVALLENRVRVIPENVCTSWYLLPIIRQFRALAAAGIHVGLYGLLDKSRCRERMAARGLLFGNAYK